VAVIQLQTLSGIAKGLTRVTDLTASLDMSPEDKAQFERMQNAYEDIRMIKLREVMFGAIRNTVDLWSIDAGISDVCCLPFIMHICNSLTSPGFLLRL
jgi:hypothetical protein